MGVVDVDAADVPRPDQADPGVSRRRRRGRGHAPGVPRNIGWLYVLPGLLVYLLFTLAPLVHTVYYSLFSWDGLTAKTWVGLANYSEAVRDHILLISFVHSAILIVFYAVIPVMLGLLLTAALTRSSIRGFRFFRTTLYLPYLLAGVVIAQAWTWVYDASGPLNRGLELVGLGSLVRPWLGDFTWALPSIGVIGTWFTFGLCMVLFVAGVQKIPQELYDAARVDGAGAVREFFAVTLPGLRNEVLVAFVLTTINALRSFDIVYNTTSGGPANTDDRPVDVHVPERVSLQSRRVRGGDRDVARTHDLHPRRDHAPCRRPGRGAMTAGRLDRLGTYLVLGTFALIAIYPIVSILFLALHKKTDLVTGFAVPTHIDLSSFKAAWTDGRFTTGYKASFIVAVTVTAVSAVLSIGTGYAFGTMRFVGDRIVFPVILLGIIFPYEATVIPLYYDFQDVPLLHWNLLNTYWALILPQIGQSVAFGTFWMRAFFRSVPRSLIEAARIDGATSFGVLWRVLLPQSMPAVMTLCVLVFTYTWNEFLLALVLVSGSESHQTAPLGLSFFAGAARAGDPTKVAAAAVLVALPIVVVYLFLQRHFVRGMLGGSIKE